MINKKKNNKEQRLTRLFSLYLISHRRSSLWSASLLSLSPPACENRHEVINIFDVISLSHLSACEISKYLSFLLLSYLLFGLPVLSDHHHLRNSQTFFGEFATLFLWSDFDRWLKSRFGLSPIFHDSSLSDSMIDYLVCLLLLVSWIKCGFDNLAYVFYFSYLKSMSETWSENGHRKS